MKCNEIFTNGLLENLKGFVNKRKVKHNSTVLEPSILFHTLVKLVDAEDIATDEIGTNDLVLELTVLQINYKSKLLTLHNVNNLCLHNLDTRKMKMNVH